MPNSPSMSYDDADGVPAELKKLAQIALRRPFAAGPIVEYPPKRPSPPAAESSSRALDGSGVQKKRRRGLSRRP